MHQQVLANEIAKVPCSVEGCLARIARVNITQHINSCHNNLNIPDLNILFQSNFSLCPNCPRICKSSGLRRHILSAHPGIEAPGIAIAEEIQDQIAVLQVELQPVFNNVIADDENPNNQNLEFNAIPPPIFDTIFSSNLLAKFNHGLYYVHHSWINPLLTITNRLLADSVSNDIVLSDKSVLAFMILPGFISALRSTNSRENKVINFLHTCTDHDSPCEFIVQRACAFPVRQLRTRTSNRRPTPKSMREKIVGLVREGRVSSAVKQVPSLIDIQEGNYIAPELLTPEAIRNFVIALHPAATPENDDLPVIANLPLPEPLTSDNISSAIRATSLDTSHGADGWTNLLLKRLAFSDNLDDSIIFCTNLAVFITRMMHGTTTDFCKCVLTCSRLVLIVKPDGGRRPLGIGSIIYRLASRITNKILVSKSSPYLIPHQLCTLPAGVEVGVRISQLYYDKGLGILSLDAENAFNCIPRVKCYNAIIDVSPECSHFFRWSYGSKTELRGSDGTILGYSETGVRQGDPLSMTAFALGFQSVLTAIQHSLRAKEAEHNITPDMMGQVYAFADDTYIACNHQILSEMYTLSRSHINISGLNVREPKCFVLGREASMHDIDHPNLRVLEDGAVILGAPVGNYEFLEHKLSSMINALLPPDCILQLPSRAAFRLIKECYNARPTYLIRTAVSHDIISEPLSIFDNSITHALAKIIYSVGEGGLLHKLRSLPLKFGGWGIPQHRGSVSERHIILSRIHTLSFVTDHIHNLLSTATNMFIWPEIIIGKFEQVDEESKMDMDAYHGLTLANVKGVTSKGLYNIYKFQFNNYITGLREERVKAPMAAALLSREGAYYPSTYLSNSRGINEETERQFFTDEEFVLALRNDAGISPTELNANRDHKCRCNSIHKPQVKYSHGLDCSSTRGLRIARHHILRDYLASTIKKMFPEANIRKEHKIGVIGESDVIMDIVVEIGLHVYNIDLAVVNPGAESYLNLNVSSHRNQLSASGYEEANKRRYYARVLPAVNPVGFVPFVIEATGRLGRAAREFLDIIGVNHGVCVKRLLREVSFVCARFRGKMLSDTLKGYVLAQVGGIGNPNIFF